MEEESREESTLEATGKKKKKQLSSEKAVTLSIKLGAVIIIVGLLALAIYFATGKKKDGKGLIDDSDVVQGFLDQLTETTDKMGDKIGEYSKDEIDSIYRDIEARENISQGQQPADPTKEEACKSLYSILASIEDGTPLEILKQTIDEKAGYTGEGQAPNYAAWMALFTPAEWRDYLSAIDSKCPNTSRSIKQLYPNLLRKAQG